MTFPGGPPPGRSLPTWHVMKENEKSESSVSESSQKTPKEMRKPFKRPFHVNFMPKKNKFVTSTSHRSIEAENVSVSPSTLTRPNEIPFRLLDLPRELRDRIYDFLIYDPGTDPCDKFQPPSKKRFETRPLFYNLEYNACILATCHQVQHEFAQVLCIKKDRSAVPAVITYLHETVPYQGRGPYYYKNYQPIPINVTHLTFFAPFAQFLKSVVVRIAYRPLPGWTQWDPEVTIPDDVQINVIEPLIAALRIGKNLSSVRIKLSLGAGKFELGWVSREMERFKSIPGFELVHLDVTQVLHKSASLTHTLWVIPRGNGEVGWKHIDSDIDFFRSWQGPHDSSLDVRCFECWRKAQQEGFEEFPGFRTKQYQNESFLKLKKLEAPEFTWDCWRRWEMPKT